MRGVERTIRRWIASTPRAKYVKEKVKGYKQNFLQILGIIRAPRPSPGEDYGVGRCTTTTGMASHLSSQTLCEVLINPQFFPLAYNAAACGHLLIDTVYEVPSTATCHHKPTH